MNTPPDNDGESAPTDEVLSGEVVATPDGADSVDGSPEQPGDLPGALGGLDMGAMLQMAQDMGERMQEAQEALATTEIVGSAGGGLVTVTLNGHLHVRAVHIEPGAVDADDPMLYTSRLFRAKGSIKGVPVSGLVFHDSMHTKDGRQFMQQHVA